MALEMDLPALHSCSKTCVHKITDVPVFKMGLGLNDFDLPTPKSLCPAPYKHQVQ
jgi:hypothetical protein